MPEGAAPILQRNVLHVVEVVIPGVQLRHRGRYCDSGRDAVHDVRLALIAIHCSRIRDGACMGCMRRSPSSRTERHWNRCACRHTCRECRVGLKGRISSLSGPSRLSPVLWCMVFSRACRLRADISAAGGLPWAGLGGGGGISFMV